MLSPQYFYTGRPDQCMCQLHKHSPRTKQRIDRSEVTESITYVAEIAIHWNFGVYIVMTSC